MYTIKTLNAISPVGLAKLPKNQFDVTVDADAPDGILVRSADLLNTTFNNNLLAIARAVRPDKPEYAALWNRKTDFVQCFEFAKVF